MRTMKEERLATDTTPNATIVQLGPRTVLRGRKTSPLLERIGKRILRSERVHAVLTQEVGRPEALWTMVLPLRTGTTTSGWKKLR